MQNWRKWFALLMGVALVWISALEAQGRQPRQNAQKSCLWSIQTGPHTLYLLGSIHILQPSAYPLAAAIEEAYQKSQILVFETDIAAINEPALQKQMAQIGIYPESESLYDNIDARTRHSLEEKLAAMDLSKGPFSKFRPWLAAMTLTVLELQRLGYDPAYGVDQYFYQRALRDDKPRRFLEPVDYHMNLLAHMARQDQHDFLKQTLKELDLVEALAVDMVKYWKTGQADRLHALLFRSLQNYRRIYDRLIVQRNKDWSTQIEALIKQKKNFLVVVGAGHLIGPESVIEMLRKKGYQPVQR
jgi:uncharacterized protein YbaP (TraB family)